MSTDRHQALDADERELARVLRALPAGEPPSSLDSRILAMARDAVVDVPEGGHRARRAPRAVWGLGVAASCVMAAGLVWRLGGLGGDAIDGAGAERISETATSAPATQAQRQPAAAMPEAEREQAHIAVEFGAAPSRPAPSISPPPPPPEETRARAAEGVRAERQQKATPMADATAAEAPYASAPPAPPAPAPAPAAAVASDIAEESTTLDRIVVTGTRIAPVIARPVSADGKAGAQAWIKRIRARIAAGDEDGARQSLEAFIERHPDKPLPQDLIDFRSGP